MKIKPKITEESGFNVHGKIGTRTIKAPPARINTTMKIPNETRTNDGMGRESLSGVRRLQKKKMPLAIPMPNESSAWGSRCARSAWEASWKRWIPEPSAITKILSDPAGSAPHSPVQPIHSRAALIAARIEPIKR
jgi:hypothetical protein